MSRPFGSKNKPTNKTVIETRDPGMSFGVPPDLPVEKFYTIAKVPGSIANCAVEELRIQGNQILSRKYVTDRDNRIGAESRLMDILHREAK